MLCFRTRRYYEYIYLLTKNLTAKRFITIYVGYLYLQPPPFMIIDAATGRAPSGSTGATTQLELIAKDIFMKYGAVAGAHIYVGILTLITMNAHIPYPDERLWNTGR